MAQYLGENLKSKRHQVVMMTLLALETLFLEAHSDVHRALTISAVVTPLLSLVDRQKKKGHENAEVSNKALDLIRSCWFCFVPPLRL